MGAITVLAERKWSRRVAKWKLLKRGLMSCSEQPIEQKRLIRFSYKDKPRIVEPHDYGVRKGSVKLLSYQVGGSSSEPLPNWRWVEVSSISDLHLLNRTFRAGDRVLRVNTTNGISSSKE
jgi:hypothetical protein